MSTRIIENNEGYGELSSLLFIKNLASRFESLDYDNHCAYKEEVATSFSIVQC
jgi:hypothetical protein